MDTSSSNIARSLTTRINRKISITDGSGPSIMSRAFSTRKPQEKVPHRPEISLPLELLSATNPLAFNAPDLPQKSLAVSPSGTNTKSPYSPSRVLASTASSSSLRSDGSVPGLSTTSSVTSPSPLQTPVNEATEGEFHSSERRLTTLPEIGSEGSIAERLEENSDIETANLGDSLAGAAPVVPKRAPSHTKRTHQVLARQRSLSRIGARSPSAGTRNFSGQATPESRQSSSSTNSDGQQSLGALEKDENGVKVVRNSIDIFASVTHDDVPKDHPFGAELAQLNEIAEEFSPTKAKHDADDTKGLRRERSFKALRRGLSRKEKKQDTDKKAEEETEVESVNALQRQRSFKVLRRDPSTKELKPSDLTGAPKLEKAEQPVQEQISVPRRDPSRRDPSRRRAPTVTRQDAPTAPLRARSVSRARQPQSKANKIAVPSSEPTVWDEESAYLNKHGLRNFSAEDYMAEIGSPFASTFGSPSSGWL